MIGSATALAAIWLIAALFRIVHPGPGTIDVWWNTLMTGSTGPTTHAIASVLAVMGTGLPAAALAVLVGLLLGIFRGWAWGVCVVAASLVSALDVAGMKTLAHRTRPDPAFGLHNAFPSGHTANAALLGVIVFLLVSHRAVRAISILWFLTMAWSRTALHAHWMTDVVAAVIAGTASAVLLVALTRVLANRSGRIAGSSKAAEQ